MGSEFETQTMHASCVAIGALCVLITGSSGSGKSALALELMARGAVLVADDRTILTDSEIGVKARCPKTIAGKIEARGVGILAADFQENAVVRYVVDLDQRETDRLPHSREIYLLNHSIPLLRTPESPHFPAAIIQMLKGGRIA